MGIGEVVRAAAVSGPGRTIVTVLFDRGMSGD